MATHRIALSRAEVNSLHRVFVHMIFVLKMMQETGEYLDAIDIRTEYKSLALDLLAIATKYDDAEKIGSVINAVQREMQE